MCELQSVGSAENQRPPMGAEPAGGGAVSKDTPVRAVIRELCVSLDYTAEPNFLIQSAQEWLAQEGYTAAQPREDRAYFRYHPTPKGAGLGLRSAQFTHKDGTPYCELVCGEKGRQLLRRNLKRIMAVERTRWEPLLACLTPEWHSGAAVSEEPVNLTNMVKQINSCLPQELPCKLNALRLSTWLVKNGLMEAVVIRGKVKRQPTAAGKGIGIQSTLWRKNGTILWLASAQRFVWDNLAGIIRDLASGEAYKWGPREPVFTEELRRGLRPVPKPVPSFYLDAAINTALDGGKGYPGILPKGLVGAWLHQEKYCVAERTPEGGWLVLPTEKGEAVGLAATEYVFQLSEAGQQFVYDNLQEIFDFYKTL